MFHRLVAARRFLVVSKTTSRGAARAFATSPPDRSNVIIPGSPRHAYGSLGEAGPAPESKPQATWQATSNFDVQRVTQQAMVYELVQQQASALESTVAWFLQEMPDAYFLQVPERFRMDHIKAIAALKDANMELYLNLKAHLPDGREVLTYIRPGTQPGTLLHMVEELPWKHDTVDYMPLSRILVFSTKDESMSLNMFIYGTKKLSGDNTEKLESGADILDFAAKVQTGEVPHMEPSPILEEQAMKDYLQKCTHNYISEGATNPQRFLEQRELYSQVSGHEGARVLMQRGKQFWLQLAVANMLPQVALENTCRLMFLHGLDVSRARLDVVSDGENGTVTMVRMLVSTLHGNDLTDEDYETIERELKRVKWLDPKTMELVFEKHPSIGVTRGEVVTALSSLLHPILSKENALAFSMVNIFETVTRERFMPLTGAIADLFMARFYPRDPLSDAQFEQRASEIAELIENDVEDTIAAEMLLKMIDVVRHTLKTNLYMPNRYALGLRLDPRIMVPEDGDKEVPFGVFFAHGRRFNAFHVRFRDIARGGMRLVTPSSAEQFALESSRQFDECYGLAFAQQLKNKDIPEGGSKAVNLINTVGLSESAKNFVMRKSVKAFVDALLDLIVPSEMSKERIVDLYGKKEVLYLGPDEQVIPEDINWIIKRAAYRGYDTPNAFMSSKPRAGINHKEFGVTSEGVNVYLEVALKRALGIDPRKDSFTIKLTGGPDGDVAGNEIKILCREYGDNAKIVGICDISGSAEDPNGLSHDELLRLVNDGLSIAHFNPSKLSSDGVLHTSDTPEGVKARNTMHNRLKADAFVPCGGRPATIDMTNYQHFLGEDGTPSSTLVVEGANLFVTAEARQALFDEAGVLFVKDSSANKGGVITSSYEICAAMLLDEETFFEHKSAIVEEVLGKIRELAELEASLLFNEFETSGGSLPDASKLISDCINAATDALSTALDTLSEHDRKELLPLFRAHLPKTLADLSFDHVNESVPEQYIKNAISSCLASALVYKEGTNFISTVPEKKLAEVALKYINKHKEVAKLIESLEGVEMDAEEKERIIKLLDAGGARAAMKMF